MSLAKYFTPYCIKPIYLLDTPDSAGNCGFINGLIYSVIFTVSIIIIGLKFYVSERDEIRRKYILYGMGATIALLWIICPVLFYHSNKIVWTGYNDAKIELKSQGYTQMEIIDILQMFEQHSMSLNTGGIPGGGLLFAKGTSQTQTPTREPNPTDKK